MAEKVEEPAAASPPRSWKLKPIELAIALGIVFISAGIVLPALRTAHIQTQIVEAQHELELIGNAILEFAADTGLPPARNRYGEDFHLYRLCGPGLISPGAYFDTDLRQGELQDHLNTNQPQGGSHEGYANWSGPYFEDLSSDPWGRAYIVVLYPAFLEDDRDCIVVSSGPNGRMDSSYASPRDMSPVGDDLIHVIVDKSIHDSGPVF